MRLSRAGGATAGARRWSRLSVRTKVLASVLAMTALGMVVTGVLTYVVQSRLVDAAISESLEQEVAEFRTLASQGRDPHIQQAAVRDSPT